MANPILEKVIAGNDLTEQEMMTYLSEIMSGEKTEAEIASFLTALKIKGESVSEIVAGAKVLQLPVDLLEFRARIGHALFLSTGHFTGRDDAGVARLGDVDLGKRVGDTGTASRVVVGRIRSGSSPNGL